MSRVWKTAIRYRQSQLEKMARAPEVPMNLLFHEGEATASIGKLKRPTNTDAWGNTGDDAAGC